MELIKQDICVWIKGEILPSDVKTYFVISEDTNDGDMQEDMMWFDGNQWKPNYPQFKVHTWLKPIEQVYVLTERDIVKILTDYVDNEVGQYPFLEGKSAKEFIKSITKP